MTADTYKKAQEITSTIEQLGQRRAELRGSLAAGPGPVEPILNQRHELNQFPRDSRYDEIMREAILVGDAAAREAMAPILDRAMIEPQRKQFEGYCRDRGAKASPVQPPPNGLEGPAQRAVQVFAAVDDLSNHMAETEQLIAELRDRLSRSVLHPDDPKPISPDNPQRQPLDSMRAPLANMLAEFPVRLAGVNELLRSIARRLEV